MGRNVGCEAEAARRPQSDKHFCNTLTFYSQLWKRLLVVPWNIFQLSELSELWAKICAARPSGVAWGQIWRTQRRRATVLAPGAWRYVTPIAAVGGSDGPGCLETARKQEIAGIRPRSEEEVRSDRTELLSSCGLQGGSDLRRSQFTPV